MSSPNPPRRPCLQPSNRVQIWSVCRTRCVILMCIGEHTLFSVYSANHINPFIDWIQTNGFTLQTNSRLLLICMCTCLRYVCMQSYMHVCRHVCTGMCRHMGSHHRRPVLSWKPGSKAQMAGTLSTKPSAQPFTTFFFTCSWNISAQAVHTVCLLRSQCKLLLIVVFHNLHTRTLLITYLVVTSY